MGYTKGAALAAALSAALFGAAACGSSGSGGSNDSAPFRVLVITGFTGPTAAFGQATKAAVEAGAEVVNAHGGIGGHKVVATFEDDAGQAAQAVIQLQGALKSGTKYNSLITVTSTEGVAMVPLAMKAGLITEGPDTAVLADSSKYPLFFSGVGETTANDGALVDYLVGKGYKKLAIIASDDAYGVAAEAASKAAAAAAGATITGAVQVDPDIVDATAPMQQVASGHPDALIMVTSTSGDAGASVLEARAKLGLTSLPTYGDVAPAAYPLAAQTPPGDWKNVFMELQPFQVAGSPATKTAAYKQFRRVLAKYAPTPLTIALPSYVKPYDWLQQLAAAAKKVGGKIDGKDLAKGVRELGNGAQVPNEVAQTTLYTNPRSNGPQLTKNDYIFAPLGPQVNGLEGAPSS